ncbi:TerD family protein [Bacillus sp. AFS031507]|uniref:TerD family protein n=1 Tax=Bacillus sp. AFS031507 TaxID=2033496 RepID=UPI000BFCDC21|nr:TerD family protein [Bacillus sp. AFS031507]PGY09676.1 tellurium resistance protein [Bacillus sp. AFS031507]
MSLSVVKGQKADVTKTNPHLAKVIVELSWNTSANIDIDASAFLLTGNGKVRNDEDFVFYGQPSSVCGAVTRLEGENIPRQPFQILFRKIPAEIQKVVFSLTIYSPNQSFRQVTDINLRISDPQTGSEIIRFLVPNAFSDETAIVIGDLYQHSGQWKFNSVGAGYFGGLPALCNSFGVEVEEEPVASVSSVHIPETPLKTQQPVIAQEPTVPIVNLAKIELKKKQTVNIKKSQRVTARLEWETNKDLDLYCYYVMKNGRTGKVYYRDLGTSNHFPYIKLDGDAQQFGKETIEIYKTDELAYVLFAAYSAVGNGVGSFYSMRAKAVVDNHRGNVVVAPLLERNDNAYWVAIAQIDFTHPGAMNVAHVERYSKDHSEASPLLFPDGTFKMDVGPIEFKNDEDYDLYFK